MEPIIANAKCEKCAGINTCNPANKDQCLIEKYPPRQPEPEEKVFEGKASDNILLGKLVQEYLDDIKQTNRVRITVEVLK